MLQVRNASVQKDVCGCYRSAFLGLGGHHEKLLYNFEEAGSIICPEAICIPPLLTKIYVEKMSTDPSIEYKSIFYKIGYIFERRGRRRV